MSPQQRQGLKVASNRLRQLSKNDVFIVVLGMTGTGKSTFIAKCVPDTPLNVGHGLKSYTQGVTIHTMQRNGKTVHLIDTPGFDDTDRSDAEILQELSYWLITSYEMDLRLSGVVYLHRITDSRLQGSALRGLQVFKKMCGFENFPFLTMATTRWDEVAREDGLNRQEELPTNTMFWGDIRAAGGSVTRIEPGQRSALAIIDSIIERDRSLVLALQRELVDQELKLGGTEAGQMVHATVIADMEREENEIAALREEFSAAIAEQRDASRLRTEAKMKKYEAKLDRRKELMENQRKLQQNKSDLRAAWEPRLREDYRRLKHRLTSNERQLQQLETHRAQHPSGRPAWDRQYGHSLNQVKAEHEDLVRTERSHLGGKILQEALKGVASGLAGVAFTAALSAIACSVM